MFPFALPTAAGVDSTLLLVTPMAEASAIGLHQPVDFRVWKELADLQIVPGYHV